MSISYKRDALGFCFNMQGHTFLIATERLKLTKKEFMKKFTCTKEFSLTNYQKNMAMFTTENVEKIYNIMHQIREE